MPIGKMIGAISSVAAGSYLDVRPAVGAEWVLHNIVAPLNCSIELYYSDGTNSILVDAATTSIVDVHYHASNALYYRVKNTSAAAALIGYDGVVVYEG